MIKDNPFYILKVLPKDSREKIVEAAEDKLFEIDEEICEKARIDLITPKYRLIAELNWFPSMSQNEINSILKLLNGKDKSLIDINDVSMLIKINILNEIIEDNKFLLSQKELKQIILDLSDAFDTLNINEIVQSINEDRNKANFPKIKDKDIEIIENEIISKRQKAIKNIIKHLNDIPTKDLIKLMTDIITVETSNGQKHSTIFFDDLIDEYRLHVKDYLEEEYKKIEKLMNKIENKAKEGEQKISDLVELLIKSLNIWDDVAQPIQLSMKSRGIDEPLSKKLAKKVRNLAIILYNEYKYLNTSKKITKAIKNRFSELPEISTIVEEDIEVLSNIENRQKQLVKDILKELDVKGIENLSSEEIISEIKAGATFRIFTYCTSFIVVTYQKKSPIYFIKKDESTFSKGSEYFFISLILGWWGFPWGPIYTISSIFNILSGGENITPKIKKLLKEAEIEFG